MSIALLRLEVRNERRVRLTFTNVLASGAFASSSFYHIICLDGASADPGIQGVLLVPDDSAAVELALTLDLASGGLYQVSAVGVPAIDSSVTPSSTVEEVRIPSSTVQLNVESNVSDVDELLYGRDIIWNSDDFEEDITGDLMQLGGVAMAALAVERRLLANGLPWDPNYGPGGRQYVDGVAGVVGNLRGALETQAYLDNRVASAKATLVFDDTAPNQATFKVDLVLIGGKKPDPLSIQVKV